MIVKLKITEKNNNGIKNIENRCNADHKEHFKGETISGIARKGHRRGKKQERQKEREGEIRRIGMRDKRNKNERQGE